MYLHELLYFTTTIKVGSVQPAMLGRSVGPLSDGESTCWHHQSDTRHLTRVILASPKVVIVTGGLEGHDPLPQVEGGGQDALGSVCARSRGGRY